MKSMIALTAVIAAASAQYAALPAAAYAATYAPAFAYSNVGTPASTLKATPVATPAVVASPYFYNNNYALNGANPAAVHNYNYNAYNSAFNYRNAYYNYNAYNPYFLNSFYNYPISAAALPASPQPTPNALPLSLQAEVVEAAPEAAAPADLAVEVVEADAAPIVPASTNFQLRRIFPVFESDLRFGGDQVTFARPDQVPVIEPVKSDAAAAVVIESADALPDVPAAAAAGGLFRAALRPSPVVPAGIVQATQPRFVQSASSSPVIVL